MARDDRLEGKTLKIAEKMLRDVTKILEQTGVGYFLDAGTLLGLVRENRVATRKYLLFNGHRLRDLYIKRPIDDELCWSEGSRKIVLKAIPKRFYEETRQLEFDGKNYSVPRDCEGYLKHHYGKDWRTPIKEWNFLEDDGSTKSVIA